MKTNRLSLSILAAAACIISACSEKDTPEPDYSNCLFAGYSCRPEGNTIPIQLIGFKLEYDDQKRIKQQDFEIASTEYSYGKNKIIETFNNYTGSITYENVYTTDDNGRFISHIEFPLRDSVAYEYDHEGYLIRQTKYAIAFGMQSSEEKKYTWQGGNMVQRIDSYYDASGIISELNTLNYTYDNTPWFPETKYLSQSTNVLTGKPNRNNITDIQMKTLNGSLIFNQTNIFKSVHYTYLVKGNRLNKITMDATPFTYPVSRYTFTLTYLCD
jgi:hypothetical protein